MSYSYSYAYSHHAADKDIYEAKKSDDEGIILPTSTHTQSNADHESTVLVSTNVMTVDGNDTEISSFSIINISQNKTNNTVMVFPSAKVEVSESSNVESMSSLAKTVIGVSIGCTAVLAMLSLGKRRRQ